MAGLLRGRIAQCCANCASVLDLCIDLCIAKRPIAETFPTGVQRFAPSSTPSRAVSSVWVTAKDVAESTDRRARRERRGRQLNGSW